MSNKISIKERSDIVYRGTISGLSKKVTIHVKFIDMFDIEESLNGIINDVIIGRKEESGKVTVSP